MGEDACIVLLEISTEKSLDFWEVQPNCDVMLPKALLHTCSYHIRHQWFVVTKYISLVYQCAEEGW